MRFAKLNAALSAVVASLVIVSCNQPDRGNVLKPYSRKDDVFNKAMEIAKADHPQYFSKIASHKLHKNLKELQVLCKQAECVYMYNDFSIIIEEDLNLYCFEKKTRRLVARI